ncbi:MAG: TetR/AcrR family transcriptional regulator [Pseudomonadales bacterium]|nr:TetR/AcrR family transcriptional regulator [Pseudomonadales bacterium]MCP5185151.1 TetR/AcrR family transcriptional regulator [Pseudomonadales bacterium]
MSKNGNTDNAGNTLSWQQTKSQLTRNSILDAAVSVIYDLGYANTTTEAVARRAGVSRGAMLHHFPNRQQLIEATVRHLNELRLAMFAREESEVQAGAEYTRVEEGIDAYWRQLNTPTFIVFQELKVAARTDSQLATVLLPALKEFELAWGEASRQIFPDLALSESFTRANYMTRYILEGMAGTLAIEGPEAPVEMMMQWLKRELRRDFSDVLGTVPRDKAERRQKESKR